MIQATIICEAATIRNNDGSHMADLFPPKGTLFIPGNLRFQPKTTLRQIEKYLEMHHLMTVESDLES